MVWKLIIFRAGHLCQLSPQRDNVLVPKNCCLLSCHYTICHSNSVLTPTVKVFLSLACHLCRVVALSLSNAKELSRVPSSDNDSFIQSNFILIMIASNTWNHSPVWFLSSNKIGRTATSSIKIKSVNNSLSSFSTALNIRKHKNVRIKIKIILAGKREYKQECFLYLFTYF